VDEPSDPEISSLAPRSEETSGASRAGLHGRLTAVLYARWARLLLTTLVLLAAVACLFSALVPDALQRATTALFPPTRTLAPTAGGFSFVQVILAPAPATDVLGPPPTNCPSSSPLDRITAQPENFARPVTMYGRSPVWVPEGYMLQGTLYVYEPGGTPIPYPGLKVIWEVGPTTYPLVTARATDLRTHELAWWSESGSRPEVPVLRFGIAGAPQDFVDHPSNLILTHAGCYELAVTWDGGGWSSIFAVGGRTHI